MAVKRVARLKKILAADPAFTNVLVGILMLFYESVWIVILSDSGHLALGRDFGWDLQLISVGLTVILTAPYLLSSLFLASSMTETARRIVAVCSVLIGLAAAVFAAGVWLQSGARFPLSYAATRLPWILFGVFVLARLPMLKIKVVTE